MHYIQIVLHCVEFYTLCVSIFLSSCPFDGILFNTLHCVCDSLYYCLPSLNTSFSRVRPYFPSFNLSFSLSACLFVFSLSFSLSSFFYTSTSSFASSRVRPDWAKFCPFGKLLKIFDYFSWVYIFAKLFNLHWQMFYDALKQHFVSEFAKCRRTV